MFSRPWYHWLAFGGGSGLAPVLPGTMGTIAAIPLYLLLILLVQNLWIYTAVLFCMIAVGPWLCGRTAEDLRRGASGKRALDPPAIVWDEWVGLLLTLYWFPFTWWTLLAGFLLFRFFDMLKPWPISWLDRHIHGGTGIMLDDMAAALPAWLILLGMRGMGWL
ncbi:phosphatidylglycerophosphatase A [Acidithiobacillus montserratensis]|uniref:Phosphatidylglycerophosphatase A n=1 Tax=Acidithiobacillus montserratensis TaxID=2729135 RepID=A0ACD5HJJ8_9PROT|nr:phosphatidylglycerophosphatase A [Acidithiobacillus montserratensis]MBN2679328.1 phosphatidylglycerophosphatase A [Acidithiobacillaceae bacterium]MBU2747731.1 phosphatidylglycerophosphatase A [Acidithiobacillus montserratensis]